METAPAGGSTPQRSSLLFGAAVTGVPHLGYLAVLGEARRLAKAADLDVVAVVADYHGALDDQKTPIRPDPARTETYLALFRSIGDARVVLTSTYYGTPDYLACLMHVAGRATIDDLLKAGSGTLRRRQDLLADALYVALQLADLELFDASVVLSGVDEQPISDCAARVLGRHMVVRTVPMCPGLQAEEMHCSDDDANVLRVNDPLEVIEEKWLASSDARRASVGQYVMNVLGSVFDIGSAFAEGVRPRAFSRFMDDLLGAERTSWN